MKIAIAVSTILLSLAAAPAIQAAGGKAMGSAVAPITIELYSDFQCPHCKELHDLTLGLLISEYVDKGRVFLVRRYFPLTSFTYSRPAAYYACAADKIGKYEEVSNVLFLTQESWGNSGKVDETVASVLKPADMVKVRQLAKDPAVIAEVEKDLALGTAEKINQTPTMIISHNGKKVPVPGAVSFPILRRYLDNLLTQ